MPADTIRNIVEDEARERKRVASEVDKIDEGLDSLVNLFRQLTEERDAHRARAREVLEASRITNGAVERMERALVEIATKARSTTHGVELKIIAQVAERAIARERKVEP